MKLIIEYNQDNTWDFYVFGDEKTFYKLVKRNESNEYSLWYFEESKSETFVWEKIHESSGEAIGFVVAGLSDAMKVHK